MSDRQIAVAAKRSPTTVGKIRVKMEKSGDVSRVDTRRDTAGRRQPATKRRSPVFRSGGNGLAAVSSKKSTGGTSDKTGDLFKVDGSADDTIQDKVVAQQPGDRRMPLENDVPDPQPAPEPAAAATVATSLSLVLPTDKGPHYTLEDLIGVLTAVRQDLNAVLNYSAEERLALARTALRVLRVRLDDLLSAPLLA
jgi:hypothetical protein